MVDLKTKVYDLLHTTADKREIKKGKVYQVNNSITFNRKPMESEEFLNRMVEALGIIIDRRLKESLAN